MKVIKGLVILLLIVVLSYFLGPQQSYPDFDANLPILNYSLNELDTYIKHKDANIPNLKANNETRIVWENPTAKTPYSLVYLHGFSASPMEGDPTHVDFANKYGMNCYIPRLAGHGLNDKDSFEKLSPKALIDDAKEALAIGRLIGEKVIIMSCSTGSTLSIYLAAQHPELVEAMIMYSPNIRLADERSDLLAKPWGLQLTRYMVGERRKLNSLVGTPLEQFTTTEYKVEGLVALQNLITDTMTPENFEKINMPFMAAYYYKDEEHHDEIISIDAIKEFATTAKTTSDQKRLVALANVDTHVIPSSLYCKDLESVYAETYNFADEVLGFNEELGTFGTLDNLPLIELDTPNSKLNKSDMKKSVTEIFENSLNK